jgi:hypothetical protein
MKTRLYTTAFVLLSFFIVSCSTDSMDEQTNGSGNNLKSGAELKTDLTEKATLKVNDSISRTSLLEEDDVNTDGDPSNPRPPRK